MSFTHRWRIFYLVIFELAQKYTKALFGGFLAGLLLTVAFWRVYPFIVEHWFTQATRIGVVGEFTPNTLPLTIQKHISFGLTTLAPDGAVLPGLASTWVATDSGKTFTFFLRQDVRWHDGKPVVSADVNYNIKNVQFAVLDPKSIRITLPTPYSPLPSLFSKPIFQAGLKGMGEYKVAGIHLNGDIVTYLKLVSLHPKSTKPAAIEYRFYKTETTAVTAYKLGEIDVVEDLSTPYDLGSWKNTRVDRRVNYNRIVSLFFNGANQRLNDKNIRHALAYGVPQLKEEHAYSPISKLSWAYTDKVKKYLPDGIQAKKLLGSEKNASDSAALELTTFSVYADTAQLITDAWTSIGIAAKVKVVNSVPDDYQILLSGQDVPPDPDQYPFWHSTQTATNITKFGNVKIDKLLEDGRQEIDVEERKKIYGDFQRRIIEEAPAVFLYYPAGFTITRK